MKTQPNGYYWLVMDRLRTAVVLVRNGKLYIPGKFFGRRMSKIKEPYGLVGPLTYQGVV